ncbi:MAG TPA: YafY family protein [Acidimicrobiales bacterium]|nr:YafY family protein [Acidimicrobiales bacterium]
MAPTSSRLLRLLSLLQRRRHWGGAELAEHLEVSPRTLRRDVERLRELGYPVDARRGVDGGYQLAAGAALPPLMLDDEEAIALGVGLSVAVQGATVSGIAEASARALAKVATVMPPRLRRQVDALAAMTVPAVWGGGALTSLDPAALAVIAQASRDGEHLEFDYTARDGEESHRSVEPHRLVLLGRRWYLVAWDLGRFDWRSFRVDRLCSPATTGARSMPRELPGGDAVAFVRSGIENAPLAHRIEAVVHADADAVRARIGAWASVEELDEDRCLVTINADSFEWPAMGLGLVGAEFEVRSPPEFADYLGAWSGRFGRAAAAPAAAT